MPYMLPLLNMQAPPHSNNSKPPQQQMMRTVSISILVMSLPVLYVSFLHVPPAALFTDTTFWFLMSNSIIIVIAADSGMLFFRSSSYPSSVDDAGDADGGGLPFVVSGGEPAAFKNGHVAEEVVMPVENQGIMVLREQEGDVTMVAENDHAHALVLRDDHGERRMGMASEPAPESRDIMEVTPPPSDLAGEAVSVWNEGGGAMVRASKPGLSLAASRSPARDERQRLRRRHRHRPSHSRAFVPVQDKSVVLTTEEKQLRRAATEGRPWAAEEKESEYSRLSDEELNRRVEEFITKFNREIRLQLEREQLALAAA